MRPVVPIPGGGPGTRFEARYPLGWNSLLAPAGLRDFPGKPQAVIRPRDRVDVHGVQPASERGETLAIVKEDVAPLGLRLD
jgi:hypothetical protein